MIKKLKDVARINEKTISSKSNSSTINYIDIASVENGFVTDEREIRFSDAPTRARRIVRNNDILLSTVRPNLRHYAYIKNAEENTIASTGFAVISCKNINPRFLYYFLTSNNVTNYLSAIAESHTSTYPSFPPEILEEIDVPFPSITEQDKIADILGTLDDKIELNRQMNQTLEAMARAIFNSWFVDFDPVYAKMERRDYPLPAEIMDLFPDELEESELGLIPKGWVVSEIGSIGQIVDCLHSKKPIRVEEKTGNVLLQLSNISENGLLDLSDVFWISEIDYKKWISRIEATEGVSVITNVGRVGAAARIPKGVKAALGRNMTAIKVNSEFPYDVFLILLLKSNFLKNEIQNKTDTGTILDSLNVRNIPSLRFIYSNKKLLTYFEGIVEPVWKKMEANLQQNHQLITLRDSILPKLVNGEIKLG